MKRVVRVVAISLLVLFGAIQFVRPARTNPATDPSATLAARAAVPDHASAILDRSCRDCHSNDTRWPWYSDVAPVSWFVIDHVNHGRSHFNYSEWAKYSRQDTLKLLEGSCELAQMGKMPLSSYLWMHGDARLSAADTDAICAWARQALVASH